MEIRNAPGGSKLLALAREDSRCQGVSRGSGVENQLSKHLEVNSGEVF